MKPPKLPFAYLCLCCVTVSETASATYSIVATDRDTQQVGGAVTSCVRVSVASVYGASPGHGGINAQAASNAAGRARGVMLLNTDTAPLDIIANITAPAFDPNAATRQYGVADLAGRAAGYTGARASNYKEDRQGTFDAFTYSVQGNILTSKRVIDQAETAFRTLGCDLPARLMAALEGGAMNGEGDSRCTGPRGIPSDSASIQVDRPNEPAGTYLRLEVTQSGAQSPLIRLRTSFDQWRTTHPCSSVARTDGGSGADGGAKLDAGLETGSGMLEASLLESGAADTGTGQLDVVEQPPGTLDPGSNAPLQDGSTATSPAGTADESSGCACRAGAPQTENTDGSLALVAVGWATALVARRRRAKRG